MKTAYYLSFFLLLSNLCSAQTIFVKPYLQDAQPNSIHILWETDDPNSGVVEWGLTPSLGNSTAATAEVINTIYSVNTAQLTGLDRFTTYYYKAVSGTAESEIYHFKTPPFASDNESFRIVAMSDMQRDGSHPDKFQEVVEDGVIAYINNEIGGNLSDNIGLVLIPGDLVASGNDYSSWDNTFFEPAAELFSYVPVYPVLGNHEYNSQYYFDYFNLPENGTPGQEEHWWHTDYGNVRVIGLDSNGPYQTQEQLDWLQDVLDETCSADSIDFVFAELHHPHHSELWTPGNTDFTGLVIEKLEQFSTDCQKPSIHFFGHTHAYSRGHSRDHKHLMINAASAGGAIDNWGEFPNADYPEYAVSTDDYGFVSVEITSDADPKVVIKHYSIGDQDVTTPYALNDSLTLRKNATVTNMPVAEYPSGITLSPECVILQGNEFSSAGPQALHGQSHWQVTVVENDFSAPVAESWKNFENWYGEIDTQEQDDLTNETVSGLVNNSDYWWRVRYRDRELNWSEWSTPAAFSTSESSLSANLLLNPGAESDLDQWTIAEGVVEAQTAGTCAGTAPNSGSKYFAVGGLCTHSEVGRLTQTVDVSAHADSIDDGLFSAKFGGYMSDYNGADLPEIKILFYNESNVLIDESEYISSQTGTWVMKSAIESIPELTRFIEFEMKGTRFGGEDNDCYFDDVFLEVGSIDTDCSESTIGAGCNDAAACNYDSDAIFGDSSSCNYPENCDTCSGESDGTGTVINNDEDGDGVCDDAEVEGCQDSDACNYIAEATNDDGSCMYISDACGECGGEGTIAGCTDITAVNYSSSADCDDESCSYNGCTYADACNYNSLALIDDGTCEFNSCKGCTYPDSPTYDPTATIDDGSCELTASEQCIGDFNDDGFVNGSDLLTFLGVFGNDCVDQ